MKIRNIILMFVIVLSFISLVYAGGKTKAQWFWNLPVDNTVYGTALSIDENATIGDMLTVASTTTINQILVLKSLSYIPGMASTGTIYMDSSYVVKVCTNVTGSTRYWQNIGAQ